MAKIIRRSTISASTMLTTKPSSMITTKPTKAFGIFLRCPLCGKLSRQSNFAKQHKFPDAKGAFSRGGRGHGFFWKQIEDPAFLASAKEFIEKRLIVLAQASELWQKSRNVLIRDVPSSFYSTMEGQFNSPKKSATSSMFLKISKSSLI